jgi:tetratricopeptide (TPR) repeat protein
MQGPIRQRVACFAALALVGVALADDLAERDDRLSINQPTINWTAHLQPLDNATPEAARGYSQLQESLLAGSLDEAATAAKQIAESTAAEATRNTVLRARALHNLALVQHLQMDYDAAIQNYQAAIEVINSARDRLSVELIQPLHAMGVAYTDNGDPVAALDAFDAALHVSNVNRGPHSLEQVALLQSLQSLHEQQHDPATASAVLDRIYQLQVRQSGPDAEELLPVLRQQAEFYKRYEMYGPEYTAWYRSLVILRRHRGADDLSLVEPQLNLGRNMIRSMDKVRYRSGPTAPSAEKYLKQALSIASRHPDAGWKIKRRATLALADYYILIGMPAQGHRYYREAWALLSRDELLAQRAADLETIVPISRPHPDPYANFEYNPDVEKIDPNDYQSGLIVAEFTINTRGRAQDVEIVAQNPPEFERMEWRVKSALKDFVYRPRFVDAEVEPTPKYRYQLEYFYLPAEYEASLAKSGKLSRPRVPGSH